MMLMLMFYVDVHVLSVHLIPTLALLYIRERFVAKMFASG